VDTTNPTCKSNSENCYYKDTAELRYLLLY